MSADIYDQITHWCVSPSHLGWEYCIMYMSNNRVYWQLPCSYFTPAVSRICRKVFHLNNSFTCHARNAAVICVIPVIYLHIRTQQSAHSKMETMGNFWNMTDNCWIVPLEQCRKGNTVFCSELRAWAHILKKKKSSFSIHNLSHFIRQFSSHLKLLWWQGGILRQLMTYAKPTHCKLHSS